MNQYQFLQVTRRMEKRYGKMERNEEERYAMMLFSMESNVLKIHRKNPSANSRRLEEAIILTLYEIENRTEENSRDVSSYENHENVSLKEGLLRAFDPFANEDIRITLQTKGVIHPEDKKELATYYKEAVICLLRIKDSVSHWLKRGGADGYFEFLENYMGNRIPNDDKMNYAICIGKDAK